VILRARYAIGTVVDLLPDKDFWLGWR